MRGKLDLITFVAGKDGRPIGRLVSGKVVIPTHGFNPKVGENWWVRVEEKDRYAIAYPVLRCGDEEEILPKLPKCSKCGRPVVICNTEEFQILRRRLNRPDDPLREQVGVAYRKVFQDFGVCSDCIKPCEKCGSPLNSSTLCRLPAEYPRNDPRLCSECFPFTERCEVCGNEVEYYNYTVPYETPVAHFKCLQCGHRQSVGVGWRFVERVEGRKIL